MEATMIRAEGALSVSIADGLAWVTIERPERRNALNRAIWAALPPLADELAAAAEVRCMILRGAGREAFSAGADMSEFAATYRTPDTTAAYNAQVRAGLARSRPCPSPCWR